MVNVVLYIRVSTDEQAEKGYSLQTQEVHLRNFCKLKQYNILHVFIEDYTAWKGFDRPEYAKLKNYLSKNRGQVNYILFTQWSRFSRDTTASYIEIENLKKQKVEANAVEQWIDFRVPESQYLLAFYLAAPKVENDRLSIRTRDAMRQARKEGRWLWPAPYGYINNKVAKVLEVDMERAAIVKWCFETFSTGNLAIEEVRRLATGNGLKMTKQAFISMLKNPIYIGKVFYDALGDDPAGLANGHHEAIIDNELFTKVQNILLGKKKPYKGQTKHDQIPLIGHLICSRCGRILTGSAPSGNGGRYYYYHCQRNRPNAEKCTHSFRADNANKIFLEYLSSFEIKPEIREVYYKVLEQKFLSNANQLETEKKAIQQKIAEAEKKLGFIEDKFLNEVIDDAQYLKMSKRLAEEKADLIMKHATLAKMPTEFSKYMRFGITLLGNLSQFYINAPLDIKKN